MYYLLQGNIALPPPVSGTNSPRMLSPNDAAIQSVQEMGYCRDVIDSAISILRNGKKSVYDNNVA